MLPLQRSKLCDLRVHLELLHDKRIAGGYGLDLRERKHHFAYVLGFPGICISVHDRVYKRRLALQIVPHSGIKGLFGYISEYFNLFIDIALTQDASLALLDVARPPRCVKVVERVKTFLRIHSDAHLAGAADEDANLAVVHIIEKLVLFILGIGIVDKGDFLCGNAAQHKLTLYVVVDGDILSIFGGYCGFSLLTALRGCYVAEYELGHFVLLCALPNIVHIADALHDFAVFFVREGRIHDVLTV